MKLLQDIINTPKHTKILNIHCYTVIHGCINTRRGRENFNNSQILLDSGSIPTILMVRIVKILYPEKDTVMQWHTQAGNITTNIKVKVYLTLPVISATNVVTRKYHVDDYDKGRYDMTLGRDLLTELGFN